MSEQHPGDSVGYRKPPNHTRFRKGQSGNPSGRPKGSRSLKDAVFKALNETVTITVNGRRKKLTKLQLAIMQLVNKAAAGDRHAIRDCAALLKTFSIDGDEKNEKASRFPQVKFIIEG
jgi:hypothetical protein